MTGKTGWLLRTSGFHLRDAPQVKFFEWVIGDIIKTQAQRFWKLLFYLRTLCVLCGEFTFYKTAKYNNPLWGEIH